MPARDRSGSLLGAASGFSARSQRFSGVTGLLDLLLGPGPHAGFLSPGGCDRSISGGGGDLDAVGGVFDASRGVSLDAYPLRGGPVGRRLGQADRQLRGHGSAPCPDTQPARALGHGFAAREMRSCLPASHLLRPGRFLLRLGVGPPDLLLGLGPHVGFLLPGGCDRSIPGGGGVLDAVGGGLDASRGVSLDACRGVSLWRRLQDGGAPGIADEFFRHGSVPVSPPARPPLTGQSCGLPIRDDAAAGRRSW